MSKKKAGQLEAWKTCPDCGHQSRYKVKEKGIPYVVCPHCSNYYITDSKLLSSLLLIIFSPLTLFNY